jgi:hypothetical protein
MTLPMNMKKLVVLQGMLVDDAAMQLVRKAARG